MDTSRSYSKPEDSCRDAIFTKLEDNARAGNWRQTKESFVALQTSLEAHLTMEEELLFPTFEKITGNLSGPTGIMRMEHGMIRNLLMRVAYAIEQLDADDFLYHSHNLLAKLQGHNLKEEKIIQLMADCILLSKQVNLIDPQDIPRH